MEVRRYPPAVLGGVSGLTPPARRTEPHEAPPAFRCVGTLRMTGGATPNGTETRARRFRSFQLPGLCRILWTMPKKAHCLRPGHGRVSFVSSDAGSRACLHGPGRVVPVDEQAREEFWPHWRADEARGAGGPMRLMLDVGHDVAMALGGLRWSLERAHLVSTAVFDNQHSFTFADGGDRLPN